MSSPSRSAPASPMKIRAGWKLWGRKPRQAPSTDGGHERADVVRADGTDVGEALAVEERAAAAMATMPAASPSRPSMKLMALVMPITHSTVSSGDRSGDSDEQPGEGDAEEQDAHAGDRQRRWPTAPCRRSWPAATPRGGRRAARRRTSRPRPGPRRAGSVLAVEDRGEVARAATPRRAPARNPRKMAAPPSSAVGCVWTRRSSGCCTAPIRKESRRKTASRTTVTRAAASDDRRERPAGSQPRPSARAPTGTA